MGHESVERLQRTRNQKAYRRRRNRTLPLVFLVQEYPKVMLRIEMAKNGDKKPAKINSLTPAQEATIDSYKLEMFELWVQ